MRKGRVRVNEETVDKRYDMDVARKVLCLD